MKKLAWYCLVFSLSLLCIIAWLYRLPSSEKISFTTLPMNSTILLVPLDSRPVCSSLPQQLGALAGINVILPSKELLDNYQIPADRKKLYFWLEKSLPQQQEAILAADLLIHGGLLNSRIPLGKTEDYAKFLQLLQTTAEHQPQTQLSSFVIVPRLLVSDQLLPDRWYQWHLRRYAELRDMTETFNDPYLTQEQEALAAKIPKDILTKYLQRYRDNDQFNQHFFAASRKNLLTIIGQDDGSSFGLPNRNMNHARSYAQGLPQTALTYGADEIAALLVARSYLQKTAYQPKVYLKYAIPDNEFMYMPFMPASNGETLRDKLQLLGAQEVSDPLQADFILYISCGYKDYHPSTQQAEELRSLLTTYPHVALLDLTANFTLEELLVPQLLKAGVPLNKLASYAGWNTFSNSAGTVLAQAAIFTGQCHKLPADQLPQLYAQNLNFTLTRLADDFLYQKLCHATLRQTITKHGYNPDYMEGDGLGYGQALAQDYLNLGALLLLHSNLGRTPFYATTGQEYYLQDFKLHPRYPWRRVFEIDVQRESTYGIIAK